MPVSTLYSYALVQALHTFPTLVLVQGIQQSAQEWRLKEGVAFLVHGGDYAVREEEMRCMEGGGTMGREQEATIWQEGREQET